MSTKQKIKKAWNNPSGTKATKIYKHTNYQVKDITYVDLAIEGCNLASKNILNEFSDPYFVLKVPTEETKHSQLVKVAIELADVGELIYHVVEYSITPYLIPFKVAFMAYEFASKTHPATKGFKEIYKSTVMKKELNPKWEWQRLGFYELCWGDVNLPFMIEIWNWDRFKPSTLIGACFISVGQLLFAETTEIEIRDKEDKITGTLKLKCIPSNAPSLIQKDSESSQITLDFESKDRLSPTILPSNLSHSSSNESGELSQKPQYPKELKLTKTMANFRVLRTVRVSSDNGIIELPQDYFDENTENAENACLSSSNNKLDITSNEKSDPPVYPRELNPRRSTKFPRILLPSNLSHSSSNESGELSQNIELKSNRSKVSPRIRTSLPSQVVVFVEDPNEGIYVPKNLK